MQKFIPVDTNATFNTQGGIKPEYVRIENENSHIMKIYKIQKFSHIKTTNYAEFNVEHFRYEIEDEEMIKEIFLRYNSNINKWFLEMSFNYSHTLKPK